MQFLEPAGFWVGLVAAGVLAAHLVRRRARRHTVPFLPLWVAVVAQQRGGFGSEVVRHLDLALVLLACAAIALAAGGPFLPGTPDTVRDLVLILDGGVSLRAGVRHPRMLKIAEAAVRRRAPGTRFVIIRVTDDGATVWSGDDRADALRAVRAHTPGWREPGREEALALAKEAARRLRSPDVVLCTHRSGAPAGVRMRTLVDAAPNAGISSLEVVGDPEGGGYSAHLGLRGEGAVEVVGHWSGEVKGTRFVDVPLPTSGPVTLRVKSAGDLFAPDDVAYLYLPERSVPRVLVIAEREPSLFLTAVLQALESTGAIAGPLDRITPDHVAAAKDDYDVLLFDRCGPPERIAGLRALFLAPPPGPLPFRVGEPADAPAIFDVEREAPLLKGFDLARIAPVRARAVLGGEALASAAPGPVLATGSGWIALGFDPDRCVFAASPAYPLFLRNCIAYLAKAAPVAQPEFYAVGEASPVRGVVTLADGSHLRVGETFRGPPGFWTLGKRTFAVNLLEPELDLNPPAELSDPLPGVGEPGQPAQPLTPPFAAFGILCLLLAWWAFWRSF